jgi:hypothetical protein
MVSFTQCGACGNSDVGTSIYRCRECETLFCSECEGVGLVGSNMIFPHGWCPNCDDDECTRNSPIGEIEGEEDLALFAFLKFDQAWKG